MRGTIKHINFLDLPYKIQTLNGNTDETDAMAAVIIKSKPQGQNEVSGDDNHRASHHLSLQKFHSLRIAYTSWQPRTHEKEFMAAVASSHQPG
jgi:hypothetical protein